jgi:hypothetical protein
LGKVLTFFWEKGNIKMSAGKSGSLSRAGRDIWNIEGRGVKGT